MLVPSAVHDSMSGLAAIYVRRTQAYKKVDSLWCTVYGHCMQNTVPAPFSPLSQVWYAKGKDPKQRGRLQGHSKQTTNMYQCASWHAFMHTGKLLMTMTV